MSRPTEDGATRQPWRARVLLLGVLVLVAGCQSAERQPPLLESLLMPVGDGGVVTSTGFLRSDMVSTDELDPARSRLLVYVPQLRFLGLERKRIREPLGSGELHRYASDVYLAEMHYFESDPGHLLLPSEQDLSADLSQWPHWRGRSVAFDGHGVSPSPFGAVAYAVFSPAPRRHCFATRTTFDPVEVGEGRREATGTDEVEVHPPSPSVAGYRKLFRMYYCQTGEPLDAAAIRDILGAIGVVGAREPFPSYVRDPAGAS